MAFQDDLKPTLRGLLRAPGFLAGAVLCLALGLGANAILFNAARALLWRPLAFRDADRVVSSFTRISNEKRYEQLSIGHAALLRDRTEAFSEVGLAQMMPEPVIVHPETDGPTLGAGTVNLDYLKALSLQPLQGRFFTEEEVREGAPVALLTETAWRTSFGADPGILGRAVPTLSMGRPGYLRIIGVVPGGATLPFLSAAQLLLPGHWIAASDGTYDGNLTPKSVLRLKPGVGLAQANAAVQNAFQVAEGAWPATVRGTRLELEHLRAVLAPVNPKAVLLLYSAAALLLMLTCANVASLFLDRALGRSREVAVRLALGASTRHLLQATFLESLLVVGTGSVLALALERMARPLVMDHLPELRVLGPELLNTDPALLGFALVTCLLVALTVAFLPALQGRRPELARSLAQGSRGTTASTPWRSSLVVAQMAIILVLLTVSGLVGRSFVEALRVDPGFDARNVLTFQASPPSRWTATAYELRDLIQELPGTESVSFSSESPLEERYSAPFKAGNGAWQPEDRTFTFKLVGSGYFETLGARLAGGRTFTEDEVRRFGDVSILNAHAARLLFGSADPVGRTLLSGVSDRLTTVVGVVRDLRIAGLDREAPPAVYIPYAPAYRTLAFHVRTTASLDVFSAALKLRTKALNPGIHLRAFESLQEATEQTIRPRLRAGFLVGGFALLGLVIGAVGLYGTLSSQVRQRRQEIGIRLAIGATPRNVVLLFLARGGRLVLLGALAGLAGSVVAGNLVQRELFEVSPLDAPSFVLALSLLLLAALLACLLPALRAARTVPAEILRNE